MWSALFLGCHAAALNEEYVSTYFLATSKGWFLSVFFVTGVAQFLNFEIFSYFCEVNI